MLHALKVYQSAVSLVQPDKTDTEYHGILVTFTRLEATWNAQIKERRERILSIILNKVLQLAGIEVNDPLDSVRPVVNPMSNSLADLEDIEIHAPNGVQTSEISTGSVDNAPSPAAVDENLTSLQQQAPQV